MKFRLPVLLLILPIVATAADDPQWFLDAIKKETPNELPVLLFIGGECPIEVTEAQQIIGGVLKLGRIKPIVGVGIPQYSDIPGLFLNVEIECYKIESAFLAAYAIAFNTHFGEWIENGRARVLYDYSFGNVTYADYELAKSYLKEMIEAAMLVYNKANFDL